MKNKKMIVFSMLLIFIFLFLSSYSLTGQKSKKGLEKNTEASVKSTKSNASEEANQKEKKADAKKSEKRKKAKTNLLELFKLGGPFMWPLLIFSIIVLGVILERTIVFLTKRFNIKKFGMELIQVFKKEGVRQALAYCSEFTRNIGAVVFGKSLNALKRCSDDFDKSVEASAAVRVNALERNLNVLSTMGNIAPLTGFLGTVSGMITAFKEIALSDNVTARLVAGGIYEALITTAFGLIIAIIAVGANNFFVHKIDKAVSEIEEVANDLIEATAEVANES